MIVELENEQNKTIGKSDCSSPSSDSDLKLTLASSSEVGFGATSLMKLYFGRKKNKVILELLALAINIHTTSND